MLMAFHPSTDPRINDMRVGCLCQADRCPIPVFVIPTNILTYVHPRTHIYTYMNYAHMHLTHTLKVLYTLYSYVYTLMYMSVPWEWLKVYITVD